MATSLETLRNDGVHSALFEPKCFFDGRCVPKHHGSGFLDALEKRLLRQAEVKAYNIWLEVLHRKAHLMVERAPQNERSCWLDFIFFIIGCKQRPPCALVRVLRHIVAEEVEIDRSSYPGTYLRELVDNGLGSEHRARERSESAAPYCCNT